MKRICIIVLLALALTGCKTAADIRPDTIVDIPLHPTQPPEEMTEAQTEVPTNGWFPVETTPGNEEIPIFTQPPTQPQSYDPGGYVPDSLDRAVAELINARRQEAGLAPLTLDARLCAIASVRARENTVYWGHTRPDGRAGITVLDEYGYPYAAAAENLCFGTGAAEKIVRKWMEAEAPREKLLMEAALIGVGSCTASNGVTYIAVLIVG